LSLLTYFDLSSAAMFGHQPSLFINTVTMFGLLGEQCNEKIYLLTYFYFDLS